MIMIITTGKRLWLVALALALAPVFRATPVTTAAQPTGEEIMRQVEALQDNWEDEVATITFLIIRGEKKAATRVVSRKRKNYWGERGLRQKTVFLLRHPPKLNRFAYLSWSYVDEARVEDHWYYTPSGLGPGEAQNEELRARKTLRLNYDPADRFMTFLFQGIDFTYADLSPRVPAQDAHRLLREEAYNYKDCYVVESVPRDGRYPYGNRVSWIWKERHLPIKVDHFDRRDRLIRTLSHHYWMEVQGVWVPQHTLMKDHRRNHVTLLWVNEVQYNTGLTDAVFLPATLEYAR